MKEISEDSQTDEAFARHFAALTDEERRELVFAGARISDEEFTSLLRALIIDFVAWNEDIMEGEIRFSLWADGEHQVTYEIEDDYDIEEVRIDADFYESMHSLRNLYLPRNPQVIEHPCVLDWIDNMEEIAMITISNPSRDEQLEAALRWREWKENHEKI